MNLLEALSMVALTAVLVVGAVFYVTLMIAISTSPIWITLLLVKVLFL